MLCAAAAFASIASLGLLVDRSACTEVPRDPAPRTAGAILRGTVVLGPRLASRKVRFNLYPDAAGPVRDLSLDPLAEELKNVVVYLESATPIASRPPTGQAPVIRQENETFFPHVLPVVKGTTVEFRNDDPLFHNVFSLSGAATFDLGRFPKGSSKALRLERPGVVKVFCHIHSDMGAVILVLDNPHFTVPDLAGRYVLEGVPPGEYVAVAWQERCRPVRRRVSLKAGESSEMDFSLPLAEPDGRE